MSDEQRVVEPAARHMQKPSFRQRLAAPKKGPVDDSDVAYDANRLPAASKALKRKRGVALVITVLVAIAIPALLLALLLAG